MDTIKLTAPKGVERVPYGNRFLVVELDGTLEVPTVAAEELVAGGCTCDGAVPAVKLDDCDANTLRWLVLMHQHERAPLIDLRNVKHVVEHSLAELLTMAKGLVK